MSIVTAVAVVTVIGLLGAAILVVAAHFMHVEEDPRVGEVLGVLPGANCGACGYAGCADYAKAIVEGAPVNKCVPGGAKCAAAAAAIMGVEAGEVVKRKAIVACQGSYDHTQDKYEYEGIESCAACAALYSGRAACEYGCLGYGDCVKACKFDAITVSNGLARVNPEKCTGCGACEQACPKKVTTTTVKRGRFGKRSENFFIFPVCSLQQSGGVVCQRFLKMGAKKAVNLFKIYCLSAAVMGGGIKLSAVFQMELICNRFLSAFQFLFCNLP